MTVPTIETLEKYASVLVTPLCVFFYDSKIPLEKPHLIAKSRTVLFGETSAESGGLERFAKARLCMDDRSRSLSMYMAQNGLSSGKNKSRALARDW
jgi:hypothetical protein